MRPLVTATATANTTAVSDGAIFGFIYQGSAKQRGTKRGEEVGGERGERTGWLVNRPTVGNGVMMRGSHQDLTRPRTNTHTYANTALKFNEGAELKTLCLVAMVLHEGKDSKYSEKVMRCRNILMFINNYLAYVFVTSGERVTVQRSEC